MPPMFKLKVILLFTLQQHTCLMICDMKVSIITLVLQIPNDWSCQLHHLMNVFIVCISSGVDEIKCRKFIAEEQEHYNGHCSLQQKIFARNNIRQHHKTQTHLFIIKILLINKALLYGALFKIIFEVLPKKIDKK